MVIVDCWAAAVFRSHFEGFNVAATNKSKSEVSSTKSHGHSTPANALQIKKTAVVILFALCD
jgi:hypothetical protein